MFREQQANYYIHLCRTLSFSRTAEIFSVSRQAVSQAIQMVEAYFRCQCFEREKKKLVLTDAGREVQEFLTRELDALHAVQFRLRCMQSGAAERLVIGIQADFSMEVEYSHAILFEEEMCGRIQIILERHTPFALYTHLLSGRLDAILAGANLISDLSLLSYQVLDKQIPFVLLVSDKNPDAKPEATFRTFSTSPLLVEKFNEETTAAFQERAEELAKRCGLQPSAILAVPNRESAYMGVRMQRGVLLCTVADKFIHSPEMIAYDTGHKEPLLFAWRKGNDSPLILQYLAYKRQRWQEEAAQIAQYQSHLQPGYTAGGHL